MFKTRSNQRIGGARIGFEGMRGERARAIRGDEGPMVYSLLALALPAEVAELADAQASGACGP